MHQVLVRDKIWRVQNATPVDGDRQLFILAGDRPLSFFEHHIRCGNSLLGTWLDTLHIPPHPDLEPTLDRDQLGLFEHSLKNVLREALQQRLLIDAGLPADIRKDTPQEYD